MKIICPGLFILIFISTIKLSAQDSTQIANFRIIGNITLYMETVDYSDSTVISYVQLANPAVLQMNSIAVNLTLKMIRFINNVAATKQELLDFNNKTGIKDPNNLLNQ